MDIHNEVDHILASLSQPPQLRFEFHQNGCTIVLANTSGEHKYEMSLYQLLTLEYHFRVQGEEHFLFQCMQAGTIAYFTEEPQS